MPHQPNLVLVFGIQLKTGKDTKFRVYCCGK